MIDAAGISVAVDGAVLLAPTDLPVAAGESVAVRGENGSGKTTLLRVIAGQLPPSTGSVRVAGLSVDERDSDFRRRVAGVIGPPPFARDLTVHEQLTLIGTTWGRSVAEAEARADEVAAELGIARLGHRFTHELSSGQRQLAALATAFVRPFDVLILDEPEQRLDGDRITAVVATLNRRRAAGATILIATHSDRIAAEAADRSHWLQAA